MFIVLKIFKIVVKIILVAVMILFGYLVYEFKVAKVSQATIGSLAVNKVDDSYLITIKSNKESLWQKMVDKANDYLYKGAENRNPTKYLFPEQKKKEDKK